MTREEWIELATEYNEFAEEYEKENGFAVIANARRKTGYFYGCRDGVYTLRDFKTREVIFQHNGDVEEFADFLQTILD